MMHEKVTLLPQGANHLATQRRTCVLVLGMHRSGTSALARVLSLLGCDLPKTLLGGDKSNEAGHWESEAIVQFNDRLLASAGSSWDDWLAFNPEWFQSPRAAQFHEEASGILDAEYGKSSFFVLKDPRICRLASFWMNVLASNGVASRMLVPVRNPVEVASSLAARNGFEPAIGHLMWLRHVLESEHATRGRPRFFTSYDRLLKNWTSITVGASEALGFSWPCHAAHIDAEVASFLDRKKRHHAEAIEDTLGTLHLSVWLRDAFRIFTDWADSGEKSQDFASLDRIRNEFEAAAPAFIDIVEFSRRTKRDNARLLAEKSSQTDEVQAGDRAIAELSLRLEQNEKNATAKFDESRKDAVELSRKLSSAESLLAEQRQELVEIQSSLAESQDWVFRLTAERAEHATRWRQHEQQLEEYSARVSQLATREELLVSQNAAMSRRCDAAGSEMARFQSHGIALERSLAEALDKFAVSDAELTKCRMEKDAAERRLAGRFEEIAALTGRLRDTEMEVTSARETLVANSTALSDSRAEKAAVERRLAERFGEIAVLAERLRSAELEIATTREQAGAAASMREQLAESNAALASQSTDIAALTEALRVREERLQDAEREAAVTRETVNRLEGVVAAAEQEVQGERREASLQLAERFAEVARLTRMVREAEVSARKAEEQRDWVRETASILVGGSRSWKGRMYSLLPAGWSCARQMAKLRELGLFDAQKYHSANPDVPSSTQGALRHYLRHGLTEGRVLDISTKGDATS